MVRSPESLQVSYCHLSFSVARRKWPNKQDSDLKIKSSRPLLNMLGKAKCIVALSMTPSFKIVKSMVPGSERG